MRAPRIDHLAMAEVHSGDEAKDAVEDLSSEEVVTKYRTAAEIANDAIKAVILRGERTLTADDLEVAIGRFLERQSIIANSQ